MVRLFSVSYYLTQSEVSLTFCFHTRTYIRQSSSNFSEFLKVRWFASVGKSVQKTIKRHVTELKHLELSVSVSWLFCNQVLSSQKKVARLEMITFRKVRKNLKPAILSHQKASKLILLFLNQKFILLKKFFCYSSNRQRNIFEPKNITFYKNSSINMPNFLQFTLVFSLSRHLSLSVYRVLRSLRH